MGISFPKKVDHSRTLLIPKMISLLLLIPLSSSRLLDELKSPSFLDEDKTEMRGAGDSIVFDNNDRACNCDCSNAKTEVTTEDYGHGCYTYDNQLCKFPFEHNGVTYNTCTSVELDYAVFALNVKNGINWDWCKTESGWGYCDPRTDCPEEY